MPVEMMKMRLTDPEVAANLRENAEALQNVGIDPDISTLRYIKLSAYEDNEPNQKIVWKEVFDSMDIEIRVCTGKPVEY